MEGIEGVCTLSDGLTSVYARCIPDTRTWPQLAIHRAVCSLPAAATYHYSCYPHRDYDLHFKHPATQIPSTHITYILVSHDRGPLTFLFPMFLVFSFPYDSCYLWLSERRSNLILNIQVQEYSLVAGVLLATCMVTIIIYELLLVNKTSQECRRHERWDRRVDGEECKALFVKSDSFRLLLDSGLLEDVALERV